MFVAVAEWLDGSFESQSRLEKPNSGSLPESPKICSVLRPVSSATITGLYVISEAAFTIAFLGVLLYKFGYDKSLEICTLGN